MSHAWLKSVTLLQVLNQTYSDTGRLMGGAELMQHFVNRSFNLPTGEVYINQDGERSCDISFDLFNSANGDYVVRKKHREFYRDIYSFLELRIEYPFNFFHFRQQPILSYDHKNNVLKNLEERFVTLWPNGIWPPKNEPICGFRNDRCLGKFGSCPAEILRHLNPICSEFLDFGYQQKLQNTTIAASVVVVFVAGFLVIIAAQYRYNIQHVE